MTNFIQKIKAKLKQLESTTNQSKEFRIYHEISQMTGSNYEAHQMNVKALRIDTFIKFEHIETGTYIMDDITDFIGEPIKFEQKKKLAKIIIKLRPNYVYYYDYRTHYVRVATKPELIKQVKIGLELAE